MDEFPAEEFTTSEQLLRRLQERSDDFEHITVMVVNDIPIKGPQGQGRLVKNCCALIKLCNGESLVIHRDEFEVLLNEGILQRLKIPLKLLPQIAR